MKVTSESIGGKPYTVIRKPFDAEWVKEQLSAGIPIVAQAYDGRVDYYFGYKDNRFLGFLYGEMHRGSLVATINKLPPLPRKPTTEDSSLLHLYAAHGLYACGTARVMGEEWETYFYTIVYSNDKRPIVSIEGESDTITHCVTEDGERIDVAIVDREDV